VRGVTVFDLCTPSLEVQVHTLLKMIGQMVKPCSTTHGCLAKIVRMGLGHLHMNTAQ
jgi:hypothetical protein